MGPLRVRAFFCLAAVLVGIAWAADWPMPGGNPQRNGWAASERQITKANAGTLKLLYKYQTDNQSRGPDSLTTPIISGNLITYRGFKEMLMLTGSSEEVYSIDADLNQLIWERTLPDALKRTAAEVTTNACPGGLSAPVVMAGSSSNSLHFASLASRAPAATGVRRPRPNPYFPPLNQSLYPLLPTTLTQLNAIYTVSSDGYLHILNSSTGQDLISAFRFVPPNAKVTSLNVRDNVVYAVTADGCDGYQNALFAIDVLSSNKTVNSFVAPRGGFAGSAGTAIGNDGTVYVQVAYPKADDAKHFYETVVALTPKDLKVKDYFRLGNKSLKNGVTDTGISPVVFSAPARDLIIAGGSDGKVYLLDSRSLGGTDHKTPLFAGGKKGQSGLSGAFSTWFDVDTGTRRFYAPVLGKKGSSVIAFELSGTADRPVLQPLWTSTPLASPSPVVIANGMVFVLSRTTPGALHVLDATTGKELNAGVPVPASPGPYSEIALANGRIYISGSDNAVYCFGIPAQQSQLTRQ